MVMPSGHHKRFHPFERSLKFVLLDGAGRVNMLRANPRTFTNERASPDALRMRQQAQPFLRTLIAVIQVVALRERNCSGPHECRLQSHHRTSRIAQRAIDAHAELLVEIQLLWCLQKFAGAEWWLVLAYQPRLHTLQLNQKIAERSDEIAYHRKIAQWLNSHLGAISVRRKKCRAGQLRLPVHHHPATAADAHATRPAIGQ